MLGSVTGAWAQIVTAEDGYKYWLNLPEKTAIFSESGIWGGDVVISETITYNSETYTVTAIETGAFSGGGGSVIIPRTVTYIGNDNFATSFGKSIYCYATNPPALGTGVFRHCVDCILYVPLESLDRYKEAEGYAGLEIQPMPVYCVVDGIEYRLAGGNTATVSQVIDNSETTLVIHSVIEYNQEIYNVKITEFAFQNWNNLKSIILQDGFSSIGYGAFSRCTSLTDVYLPNSIHSIDTYAFAGCSNLLKIHLPEGLTSIPTQCFTSCYKLEEVNILPKLEEICMRGFAGTHKLTTLWLPESLNRIENMVFEGSNGPKTIYCWNKECPNVTQYVFDGYNYLSSSTLYVPAESLADYQQHSQWGRVGTIIGLTLQEFKDMEKADFDAYVEELTGGADLSVSSVANINTLKASIDAAINYNKTRLALLAAKEEISRMIENHTHDYASGWSSDGTQHWHECTSEYGICMVPIRDEAEHTCGSSITNDVENYTCSVCGYVDEEKKAQFDSRDYFSLKAVDGDVTLGMSKTGTPDNCVLQVSEDGNIWSAPMSVSETTENIVTIPSGETRYFRRGSTTATDKISMDYFDNYWSFTMDGSGNVEADGNIMSLLDLTCQQTTMDINAFTKLFTECVQLDKVTVNSQALMNSGNMNYVFANNVKTYVIGKDVTSIGNSAFSRNIAVTSVTIPEGVTSIGSQAFELCGGLTSIVIPSTVQSIGSNAFARCQNISEFTLKCPSTCTISSNALSGVSGYKIIVPALTTHSWTSNAMWETYGSHFTEPTFTLHANQDPDNAGNWYTTFYYSHYAYDIPEGVKAYKAMIEVGDAETVVKLTAIEGNVLPKGEAVLLYSDVSGDIEMTIIDNNDNNDDDNQFCGVDAQTAQEDYGTYNFYMLSYGQNQLGFYKMSDSMMLSANKAFIVQSPGAPAKAMRMVFADDVDGIESISSDSANSPIVIFSVSGVRLNKLQNGINIVNGKKIIVK